MLKYISIMNNYSLLLKIFTYLEFSMECKQSFFHWTTLQTLNFIIFLMRGKLIYTIYTEENISTIFDGKVKDLPLDCIFKEMLLKLTLIFTSNIGYL